MIVFSSGHIVQSCLDDWWSLVSLMMMMVMHISVSGRVLQFHLDTKWSLVVAHYIVITRLNCLARCWSIDRFWFRKRNTILFGWLMKLDRSLVIVVYTCCWSSSISFSISTTNKFFNEKIPDIFFVTNKANISNSCLFINNSIKLFTNLFKYCCKYDDDSCAVLCRGIVFCFTIIWCVRCLSVSINDNVDRFCLKARNTILFKW